MSSSEEKKLVEEVVKRDTWERPALRLLVVSQAESTKTGCYDDAGGAGGNCGHHLS